MAHLEGKPHDQENLNQELVNVIQVTHEEKDESTEVFNFVFKAHEVYSTLSNFSLMMAYILYWSVELTRISYYRGLGPVEQHQSLWAAVIVVLCT